MGQTGEVYGEKRGGCPGGRAGVVGVAYRGKGGLAPLKLFEGK